MPHSMTGFGRAVHTDGDTRISATVKSVNHRSLKLSARVSESLLPIQAELEKRVRSRLARGAVTLDVSFRAANGVGVYRINRTLLKRYARTLTDVACDLGGEALPLRLELLCQLPGVVEAGEPEVAAPQELLHSVGAVLDKALAAHVESRAREGQALTETVRAIGQGIGERLDAAESAIPEAQAAYLDRCRARLQKILAGSGVEPDETAVARELAMHAERTDVAEEVARLRTHLVELDRALAVGGPVGRRLDFLAQELMREANTLASKAADSALLKTALEIKVAADQVKEQVANLE